MTSWRSPRAGQVLAGSRARHQRVEDRAGPRRGRRPIRGAGRRRTRVGRRAPASAGGSASADVESTSDWTLRVKLMMYRWQASSPRRARMSAIARKPPRTSSTVDPVGSEVAARPRSPLTQMARQGGGMDRRCADGPRARRVEAERLELPAQVRRARRRRPAPCRPRRARPGSHRAPRGVVRRVVRPAWGLRPPGQRPASAAAVRPSRRPLPERLVGEIGGAACASLSGSVSSSAHQPCGQSVAQGGPAGRRRRRSA